MDKCTEALFEMIILNNNTINENRYYNFSKDKSNKIPSLKDYILKNLDDIEKS